LAHDNLTQSSLPWSTLLRNRSLWTVFGARFLEEPVSWFYFTWLAVYLKTLRGVPLADIGVLLILPFLTLDIGYIVGGWVASRLIRNGVTVSRARQAVLAASACCMLSSIPAVYAATSVGFTWWISLATFGHGCWGANIFTLPADLVPAHSVGKAYGLTAFGGGIGSILFIQLVGFLVDLHKSFHLVFVIAGILPMAAALLVCSLPRSVPRL
jgi:sugar phosphate permease